VCREPLDTETDEAHTHHAEGCEVLITWPCEITGVDCSQLPGCGEDVHPQCCAACTGQAM
jgi:hypothetical protein